MTDYKYKEKSYAEEILKNGFFTNNLIGQLKVLAKYYKDLEYKPKQREELLYKFCEENLEDYSRVRYYQIINSALNHAKNKKNKLIDIKEVYVSNEELKAIDDFDMEHMYKRVLFTLLVLDKLNKESQKIKYRNEFNNKEYYFGKNPSQYNELVDVSKIPKGKSKNNKTIHSIIGDLNNEGILESTNQGKIKLLFMYDIPSDDSVAMIIVHFDDIGYYYDLYKGENKVKKCECCQRPIKIKNNKNKYCNECAKEIAQKQKNQWKKDNWDNGRKIEKR